MSVRLYATRSAEPQTLSDAISLLQTPDEFSHFLNHNVTVSISWHGRRMMSVRGAQGEIEISTLIRQFLTKALTGARVEQSLQERLGWYNLWEEIERIYQNSNEELQKTWLYKYFVSAKGQDSVDVLNYDSAKELFLCFSKEEFVKIWPDEAAKINKVFEKIHVTRDMLAEAAYHS